MVIWGSCNGWKWFEVLRLLRFMNSLSAFASILVPSVSSALYVLFIVRSGVGGDLHTHRWSARLLVMTYICDSELAIQFLSSKFGLRNCDLLVLVSLASLNVLDRFGFHSNSYASLFMIFRFNLVWYNLNQLDQTVYGLSLVSFVNESLLIWV